MIKGNAIKYGDNVDTDVIIPARYLTSTEASVLAGHCMEDLDSTFTGRVKKGDIMVAGKNFGCGSSREHAPIAIKGSGISCVVAASFARIFYRNAINIGLSIIECPEAASDIQEGDAVEIDVNADVIYNVTQDKKYNAAAFPPFIQEIMKADGLIKYVAEGVKKE